MSHTFLESSAPPNTEKQLVHFFDPSIKSPETLTDFTILEKRRGNLRLKAWNSSSIFFTSSCEPKFTALIFCAYSSLVYCLLNMQYDLLFRFTHPKQSWQLRQLKRNAL